MPEFLLILFAAGLIYFVGLKVAPQNLIFKFKKEEESSKKNANLNNDEVVSQKSESLIENGQNIFNKGDYDSAEKIFIKAIKEDPKSAIAYHFLGMIYLRQKEYDGAIESLELATKLDPLNDTAFNNLGLSYFNTKNYEKAIENINKSIALNDSIGHRYSNLALAYQKLKNYEKAAVALESAIKIHANVENLTMLTKTYQELKDKKLTIRSLDRLLEIDPQNSWAKRQIASLKH